jgi:ankyrin repeat protein
MDHMGNKNPANNVGNTPFHLAAENGQFEICKLFIDNICHKNPENNEGYTPLYMAFQNHHFEICKLIIDNSDGQ